MPRQLAKTTARAAALTAASLIYTVPKQSTVTRSAVVAR
jgi:hypothetical protein